jgi:hypothetical protein
LSTKLPLVRVMWKGYAATYTDLRIVVDRRGYRAF